MIEDHSVYKKELVDSRLIYAKARELLRGNENRDKLIEILPPLFFLKALSVVEGKALFSEKNLASEEGVENDNYISPVSYFYFLKNQLKVSGDIEFILTIQQFLDNHYGYLEFEMPELSRSNLHKQGSIFIKLIDLIDSDPIFESKNDRLVAKYFEDLTYRVHSTRLPQRLPETVRELVVGLLKPNENERIHDPFCTNGDLLTQAYRWIESRHGRCLSLFSGQERNHLARSLAKQSFALHKGMLSIESGDALQEPKFVSSEQRLKKFEVVISSPPWGESWSNSKAKDDDFGRFKRGVPAKNRAEWAYISHMLECMDENEGRMGVVVPSGVVFRQGKDYDIRKNLVDERLIDAVINIPGNIFPRITLELVILIFKKNREDDSIFFLDASQDFRALGSRASLPFESIEKILNIYKNKECIDGYSKYVSFDEIAGKDYNLSVSLYTEKSVQTESPGFDALFHERKNSLLRLNELNEEIAKHVTDLSFKDF